MSKSNVLFVTLLLAAGLFALWRSQTEAILRDRPDISAVRIDAEGRLTISGALAPDCFAGPQAHVITFPNNLDIQLYRDRSSLAACGLRTEQFSLELARASDTVPAVLIINDGAWARASDEPGGDVSYEAQSLFPAHIESARLALDEIGDLHLSLRGGQALGCDLPEIYTMRQAEGRILIGVFNAMGADTACPDMLVNIDETISLPATELSADTLFGVNTFLIDRLETINVNDSDKVLTNISSVDVNVNQARVSLDIAGEHPDGCDLPVQVEQSRAGNTVNVEIYRIVPADMICPMILRPYQGRVQLDGEFEAGSYTIRVNSHSQTLDI
ncbi:MAG: hypothetical protein OXG78_07315 [Chloroflexi bacterium]|nr:hypothetical protein [Chloroflexota bacterium]